MLALVHGSKDNICNCSIKVKPLSADERIDFSVISDMMFISCSIVSALGVGGVAVALPPLKIFYQVILLNSER